MTGLSRRFFGSVATKGVRESFRGGIKLRRRKEMRDRRDWWLRITTDFLPYKYSTFQYKDEACLEVIGGAGVNRHGDRNLHMARFVARLGAR